MNSDEIRSGYLKYFEEKGHSVIPSSSLIPQGDPTLLLTSAGMVQFKPYFLGQTVPPNRRLASCQKCFRTTDIESVGDPSHLTYFEMLGNFSIGDYFKKEAIAWAWEYVTKRLGLPPEHLRATIFLDDEEAFGMWRSIGVPESRIVRLGEADNFWGPAGDSGPCGPCSEIHYDFGEDVGCKRPSCGPSCKCGRFMEIWNLVFTQYNQDKDGKRTPLPKPNIDTGMGLERVAAVMQGVSSVYDTDVFAHLLERVAELSGKRYDPRAENAAAIRVIAEHSRGITFLIGDGVLPGNDGRGYVLRRLLRRAVAFGRRLGLDKPFLTHMAAVTINQWEHVYPELRQRQNFITRVIEVEENRFNETLSTGLELLENIMIKVGKGSEIPGKDAFRLYDTYGFPVELTREIAEERGFKVDTNGFNLEMEAQRERARASHKFIGTIDAAGLPDQLNTAVTPFVGYHSLKQNSVIVGLVVKGQVIETIAKGQDGSVVLETTPFYGEMGGQEGDLGIIHDAGAHFAVTNTTRTGAGVIVHHGKVIEGSLNVGQKVTAEVDRERRMDISRNHTATHLLHSALRKVLGTHVQQRGSMVSPERLRFDFSHITAMTREEIQKVNEIINDQVRRNLRVYDEEMHYRKAVEEGAIALFDEKYGETVRVMKIGAPLVSAELCGGTHLESTGEIGVFQIINETSVGAGLRRIEAVTGRGAIAFIEKRCSTLDTIAGSLGSSPDEVEGKITALMLELENERKQRQALERQISFGKAESLLDKVESVNGVKLLSAKVPSAKLDTLREMSDFLRDKLGSGVVVLASVYEDKPVFLVAVTQDLVAKGYDAGKIVKQVARVAGGGGGGKPTLAQAGGKDKDKVDEALALVKSLL